MLRYVMTEPLQDYCVNISLSTFNYWEAITWSHLRISNLRVLDKEV